MCGRKHEQDCDDLGLLQDMIEAVRADAPEETQWQTAQRRLIGQLQASQKENIVMKVSRKSRSTRIRWAAAAAAAAVAIALVVGLHPWSRSPSDAFAAAVKQLRNSRTITYTKFVRIADQPPMEWKTAFKEPGYMRFSVEGRGIWITDPVQKKALRLDPAQKTFTELDFPNIPPDQVQKESNIYIEQLEELRTLPERADEKLGKRKVDGRTLQGFRVAKNGLTVWVDASTGDLVRVEAEVPKVPGSPRLEIVMTDFQFNVDLDDSLFSLTPPEGYTREKAQADTSKPNEKDLISLLRYWATRTKGGLFPPTLNPAGWAKAAKALREPKDEKTGRGVLMLRGMAFVLKMKAANDRHYSGQGVKLGAAHTPIFWWKPDASKTYRVIYGDLTVRDVAPEDVPCSDQASAP